MKNLFLTIFTATLLLSITSSAQQINYTLIGNVGPKHNGELIKVAFSDGKATKVDSAVVNNGSFLIKGTSATSSIAYIRLGKIQPSNNTSFYLTNGTTHFETADSLKYAKISGTAAAVDYATLQQLLEPARKLKIVASGQFYAIPADKRKEPAAQAIIAEMTKQNAEMIAVTNKFIADHPNSDIALESLKNLSGSVINYAETLPKFEHLSARLKNSTEGQEFYKRILASKNMAIGAKVPDFTSNTTDGSELRLAEVLKKGKYTLIDFWASWCAPCRKENPNVVKAYSTFHDKGLNILSVSLDDKKERWIEAINKDGMPWYHVSGLKGWKEPIAQLYGVEAVPQNVLVDSKGIVVAKNLRAEELSKKLQELFL